MEWNDVCELIVGLIDSLCGFRADDIDWNATLDANGIGWVEVEEMLMQAEEELGTIFPEISNHRLDWTPQDLVQWVFDNQ